MHRILPITSALAAVAAMLAWAQLPAAAAGALLSPARRPVPRAVPDTCVAANFNGADIVLKGWRCREAADPRATIVLLHGVADNRASWQGAIRRFTGEGFEVIAYDSRGHGESGGDVCTYGFLEKQDLHRVLDVLSPRPVVLVGTSLGAAIALQEAADDPRVAVVVAAETFSDLRTVATERAPFFLTPGVIQRAFSIAEQRAAFSVDEVSPARDASRITVPVLLIHGAEDTDTPPDHSRRVYEALAGPKRLIIVPGAGHNHSLSSSFVWNEVDRWIAEALERQPASRSAPNSPAK